MLGKPRRQILSHSRIPFLESDVLTTSDQTSSKMLKERANSQVLWSFLLSYKRYCDFFLHKLPKTHGNRKQNTSTSNIDVSTTLEIPTRQTNKKKRYPNPFSPRHTVNLVRQSIYKCTTDKRESFQIRCTSKSWMIFHQTFKKLTTTLCTSN